MALNIKDQEAEKLATEIAERTGDSKTGAVRQALREKRDRLDLESGSPRPRTAEDMIRFLETEIWPLIPDRLLDREPMSKAEREEILGYGPGGV